MGFVIVAGSQRLNFLRSKEKTVARLAQHANISTWIIIDDDTEMNLALVILLDRLNDRSLAVRAMSMTSRPREDEA